MMQELAANENNVTTAFVDAKTHNAILPMGESLAFTEELMYISKLSIQVNKKKNDNDKDYFFSQSNANVPIKTNASIKKSVCVGSPQ